MSRAAVMVPIKAFGAAKGRLAEVLDPGQRASLARNLAATVIRAADGLDVWVVCRDQVVARWALEHQVNVMWVGVDGLNPSVSRAVELLGERYDRIIVAHGDLPKARSLRFLANVADDEVVIITDHRRDGSNVLSLPTGTSFEFGYGPGSAAVHSAAAAAVGLVARVVEHDELSLDVDEPDDLKELP